MNISLDYDNTYTRDPVMWDTIIGIMNLSGHSVYVVTMRYPSEGEEVEKHLAHQVERIIYTSRKGKMDYLQQQMVSIDIWIDDMPWFILNDATR